MEAGSLLRLARDLLHASRRSSEWPGLQSELRESHRRKRRLMEVLDGLEGQPITLASHDTNDLQWFHVRAKCDERWPDRPERIGSGRNIGPRVADCGVLSKKPKGSVKRLQDSVCDVEPESLGGVVPGLVEVGFRKWGRT